MKITFILILFFLPLLVSAQMPDLIPELDPVQTETDAFDRILSAVVNGKAPLSFRSSYNADSETFHHSLGLRHKQIRANLNLREQEGQDLLSFALRMQARTSVLNNFLIGNYRLRFGKGLVSGTGATETQGFKLTDPGSPAYYQALGAALELSHRDVSALFFGSAQSRRLSLTDSLISALPKNRSEGISTGKEELAGFALSVRKPGFDLAGLLYYQSYDREFLDPDLLRQMMLLSIYGSARYRNLTLSGEFAAGQKSADAVITLAVNSTRLRQELTARLLPRKQIPVYAYRQTSLSSANNCDEFSYRMTLLPLSRLQFTLQATGYRSRERLSAQRPLQRLDLQGVYSDSLNSLRLTITEFNRELIAWQDSSYSDSRPQHLRIATELRRQLLSKLEFSFLFRYHLEEKEIYTNNSSFWQARLHFNPRGLKLRAGLSNSYNGRNYIPAVEELSESPLDWAKQDGLALDAGFELKIRKLKIGASGALSLITGSPMRLYVYVGM